ncbi:MULTISPECIES: hypothetical protein [Streptomyces]|uniref:Uncharacterized protein n=1 Tax=Streptomyces sviceus (strain ATCC 29083 / DSM 924 / JCM 4929 / NBRC 13980 / NCIMB 11184 / NRRL 5439 / UC 5370) TaxID=463191 RepID=D6XBA9_STRX2|nr:MULTISPECIES: hypothetical protein [Streptomyces]EFH29058.1 predicted protein [Streptomyces sviceus ATCC 29083]
MTPQTVEQSVARRPETGWSRARRLHGKEELRTCLPAVADRIGPTMAHTGEDNIFRGED